jgi:hypothetical protein
MPAEDRLDTPGVAIIFSRERGQALRRYWTWREVLGDDDSVAPPDWLFQPDPPYWLIRPHGDLSDPPETEWHDRHRWIEYRGRVDPALDDVAVSWMSACTGRAFDEVPGDRG